MDYSSVLRVVSVFNFFIEHPRQSFTIAQVVRSLKLSRSTCVHIMNGLVEAGYLYRDEDRTYVLGPAILRIGRQMRLAFTPLDIARLEIRRLADKLDAVVAVHSRQNNDVVVRERAVSSSHLSLAPAPGVRFSVQSLGLLFLCPLPDPQVEVTFDRTNPPLSEEVRNNQRLAIAFARKHGFILGLRPESGPGPWDVKGMDMAGAFGLELRPDDSYALQYLLAPVLDPQGRVAFQFSIAGFRGEYTGTQILDIAAKVRKSCGRVTTFLTGKQVFDFGDTVEDFPCLPKLKT